MTLGLLFGSFDPIHNGHLDMIRQAKASGCDEVWLIIQPFNAYKLAPPVASWRHRGVMAKLAIADIPYAASAELDPETAVTHSVTDTLKELKRLDNERQLVLVLGRDLADSFPQWEDYDEILKLCQLCEIDRSNLDISSAKIRQQLAQGDSIDKLVPQKVAEYIFEHNLYQ